MSNKAHDHVHRLVRSMTRAEKRYFKLYTSRHVVGGKSNYQLLFDAIARMQEYDEEALLKKFAAEAFTKRFAITKRRLYETILHSLDAFHAESSMDARLRRMLHQVELLHQRALYDDARKMLRSVRKLARKHDRHTILLDVLGWERRMLEQRGYAGTPEEELDELLRESSTLRQELEELDQLWDRKSRIFLTLYRHGHARDKDQLKELKQLLRHPLLRDPAALRTPRARFLYHHVHSAVAWAMEDLSTCHQHLQQNQHLLEEQAERFTDEPNLLFSVLSNRIYVATRLGLHEEARRLLKRFRLLPLQWHKAPDPDLELKVFATGSSLEMALYARSGRFEEGVVLEKALVKGLEQHGERLSPLRQSGLCYQMAYLQFGAGHPDRALKWSHRQLNLKGVDEGAEVHDFGRLLNLLIHLELENRDLLTYLLRNAERHYRERNDTPRFAAALIPFLRETMKARTAEEQHTGLLAFREALEPLRDDPLQRAVFDHLDPLAWVDSKLTGRSFAELVRERAASLPRAA